MKFWKKKEVAEPKAVQTLVAGFFSTDVDMPPKKPADILTRTAAAISRSIQFPVDRVVAIGEDGVAMDSGIQTSKLLNAGRGTFIPLHQIEWYGNQGFIGWQTCAILAQNWLIEKACTMPGKDAVRHGWTVSANDGDEIDPDVFEKLRKCDKDFKIKQNCIEFIKFGRVFGIRHALFLVDGIDYSLPFNPDGVRKGAYKGISQIDPYWMTPELDGQATADPSAVHFYEPTWWRVNGQRVHRSHFVIMRNSGQVADILKPSYFYGGIPTPQKIYERVYASERTANEAPLLAMTKRLTTINLDITQAVADPASFGEKMQTWTEYQNNFGVKVIGGEEKIEQFDTSLTGLDETIMTQYQLVAAASNVPATKLLGTTPKGFNSTGDYEQDSYHEELESIQENELTPLIDRHNLLCIRSIIAPEKPFNVEVQWNPVDSPSAKEQAEINASKAATDKVWADSGAIDGTDIRQRLINDRDSGYNGIDAIVPGGPGDREAQQEAESALEQPVTAKQRSSGGSDDN